MEAGDDHNVPYRQMLPEKLRGRAQDLGAMAVALPEVQRPDEDDAEDLVFAVTRVGAPEGVVCTVPYNEYSIVPGSGEDMRLISPSMAPSHYTRTRSGRIAG